MLFVIYRTFVIRYGILLFILVIRYSYAQLRCQEFAIGGGCFGGENQTKKGLHQELGQF